MSSLRDLTHKRSLIIAGAALAGGLVQSILILFVLYSQGLVGTSVARVEREHSCALPASVSHIHCRGPVAITTFGDFQALSSFDIASKDLPSLVSQFVWEPAAQTPALSQPRMAVPSRFGPLREARSGWSPGGNNVHLEVFELGDDRVGVCILTSWN